MRVAIFFQFYLLIYAQNALARPSTYIGAQTTFRQLNFAMATYYETEITPLKHSKDF